jgi:ribosomal RNA-processing protein 36
MSAHGHKRGRGQAHDVAEENNAEEVSDEEPEQFQVQPGLKKKRQRDTPAELSSKVPVGRFKKVVAVAKLDRRDPRFESAAGAFDQGVFDSAYSFLSEYKDSEIAELSKSVKGVKDAEQRKEVQGLLTQLQMQRSADERRKAVAKVTSGASKESRERVSSGGAAFYLKKRDLRELAAVERYKDLESKGGAAVDTALAKKRKRRAGKDRRRLPRQQPPPFKER